MRARFLSYLKLQFRRAGHFLPFALFIGLLLLFAVGAYAVAAGNAHTNDEGNMQFEIGVVGTVEEPYFDTMLFAINHLSGDQVSLKMTKMDEATAKRRLDAGEISSYVLIPDGFERHMIDKEPLKLTYVLAPTSTGISTFLANEVIFAVSPSLMEGQNTLYGLRRYVHDNLPGSTLYKRSSEVAEQYVTLILNRAKLFETTETGIVAGQGFVPYLFVSLTTFFALVWGVACVPLFSSKRNETGKMLLASGLGAIRQITAEYIAYLVLTLIGVFSAILAALFGLNAIAPDLFVSIFPDTEAVLSFLGRMAFVSAGFAALQFMLYELARGTVGALLLQTVTAVFMGYVCGCFYSSDFFPVALQRFTAFLPAGAAIRFLSGFQPEFGFVLAGYFVLFMLVICVKRRHDLAGDKL